MGRDYAVIAVLAICLTGLVSPKSVVRRRFDVSQAQFPPPRSFLRSAVESVPSGAAAFKSTLREQLRDADDEFGSRRLPLRAAVESVPPRYLLRAELNAETERLPLRDAVERRPPAYDDDLFALTDELESLGIDPWNQDDKMPASPPPEKFREEDDMMSYQKQQYYGAAKPYNQDAMWNSHYSAYQPLYSRPLDQFRIDNDNQELVKVPGRASSLGMNIKYNENYLEGRRLLPTGTASDEKRVVCYLRNHGFAAKSQNEPIPLPPVCSHAIYAFAEIHPTKFELIPEDREYDIIQGGYLKAAGLKKNNPDLKVLLAVGGSRDTAGRFSKMVSDPIFRAAFIESAIHYCKQYLFDGIDVYWQYSGAEEYGGTSDDKDNLSLLMKELKTALDVDGLILSIAVPSSRYRVEDGYDARALATYAEWVTVQAFDLRPDSEKCATAEFPAPLKRRKDQDSPPEVFYNIDYAVNLWVRRGLPKNKLVLGVPLFGRTYQLAEKHAFFPGSKVIGAGKAGPYTHTEGMLAYFEICQVIASGNWIERRDESGSPYLQQGDQWIGYDDIESLTKKMKYLVISGLSGGAVWSVDMDDSRGDCGSPFPLVTAMAKILTGKQVQVVESITEPCRKEEEGLSSDPSNCAVYFVCMNGVRRKKTCTPGNLYDPDAAVCREMDPKNCRPGQTKLGNFVDNHLIDPFAPQLYDELRLTSEENSRVVCYITNWAFYRKTDGQFVPENLDPRLCTHIVYAYASLDPEKLLAKEFDPWADIENKLYERVTSLKGVKVLLGLGGWTDSSGDKYSKMVSTPSSRKAFITALVPFLQRYGFRGLHFDWNYPKCWQSNCAKGPADDKPNFTNLIQEISSEFKRQSPPMEIGVAVSGYKEVIDVAYDVPALARAADFLSTMTYDYHGGWENVVSHGSPLIVRPGDQYPQYTTDYAIKYLISKGAPASKLLLGLPFYGQSFTLSGSSYTPGSPAAGPGQGGEFTRQPGMLAYYEICQRVKTLRWKTGEQDGAGPYAYNRDQWVGYEDPASITKKVKYGVGLGLGGVAAWTVDLDDFNNVCCSESFPLLKAASRALGRVVPDKPSSACDRPPAPVTPMPPVLTTVFESGAPTSQSSTTPWWVPTTSPTTPSPPPATQQTWWTTKRPPIDTTPVTSTTTTTTTAKPTSVSTTSEPARLDCVIGSYSADPDDCGSYLVCSDGNSRKRECAPGLHWNAAAGLCDWPASAHCTSGGAAPTTTAKPVVSWSTSPPSPPTRKPSSPRPIIAEERPSRPTYQPPTRPTYQPPTRPTKPPRPSEKPSVSRPVRPTYDDPTPKPEKSCSNGAYTAHTECDMFNVCVNGEELSQSCAVGLVWDQSLLMCDFDRGTICKNKKSKVGGSGKLIAAVLNAPCIAGQFSAYPGDCQQYQQCLWGTLQPFQCAPGLHWNKGRNICDWPANAACDESPASFPQQPDIDIPQSITTEATVATPQWPTVATTLKPTTTTEEYKPDLEPLSGHYKIVCYFTNWAWYRKGLGKYIPENIDANLCTHIVYGFAVLDYENLVIKAHDSWADFDNKFYERVVAYKKKGLKVSLALGGWNDSAGDKYSRLVNNPASRKKFIDHAVAFLQKHNFDGLDLDWEYPTCWQTDCSKGPESDKAAYSAWVRELKEAFQPLGLLLSTAVSASKTIIDAGYDVPSLARDMDWIAVMTYDYHGQWDKKTGHVAPLYYHPDDTVSFFNANYSMHYWMERGAPSRKLIMGMPLYGQSFTLGTSWDTPPDQIAHKDERGLNVPARAGGQAGEYTRAQGFLAYYEICDRIKNRGWTVAQDEKGRMGPHAYKDDQWVSFDDKAMIRKKSQYVKSLNLGGAMIWALDLDDFKNSCGEGAHPLLNQIRDVLKDSPGADAHPSEGDLSEIYPVAEIHPPVAAVTPGSVEVITPGSVEAVESEEDEPTIPGHDSEYKMVCYFTNWAWYRQGMGKYVPDDINISLCTHIVYGFAVLDTQNLITKPHDSWADIDNKFYEKVTALRKKGVKVLLALGGWNDSAGDKYSRLVNNAEARQRFANHALKFVVDNNFDGLDLDWEYPVCWQVECDKGPASDKEGFSALVKELRQLFAPKKLLLSAAVSPNKKVIDAGYDVPVLSTNLDWIAVMTYDYHGQWDKKTGHVAPMYEHPDDAVKFFNVNYTINHWISKGAARSKLVLGLSLYGQSFSLANKDDHGLNAPTYGGGEAGDFTRARGFLSYYEICDRVQNRQWQVVRDPMGRMGPYAFKGDQWVSFDDIAMIRHKTSYLKAMGLGGGMVWALDLDDFRNSCGCESYPLLSAAARDLGLIKTPQPKCTIGSTPGAVAPVTKPPSIVIQKPIISVPTQRPVVTLTEKPVTISPQPTAASPSGQPCTGQMFIPDPNDCNRYFLCNQGTLTPQNCPGGLHWTKDHCDWPANSKCVPSAGSGGAVAPEVATTHPLPAQSTLAPARPTTEVAIPSGPMDYKIICYFTNWAWYRKGDGKYTPEDIDSSLCTHIVYGFAVLDSAKLTIIPHDSWADIDNDFYGKVTALRAKGVKVLIAIGGWNDSLGDKYSRLVSNAASRARFVTNVVEFIEKWHFDGLDLDWEYPKCWQVDCNAGPASDKQNFAMLVRELRQAFAPRGWLLSAAVSASRAVIDAAYDVPSLAAHLDWIAVMAYDYHGHWDKKTGHVAPLYYYPGDTYDYFNANFSMNYWMQKGAPASKLVMGVPMYGQSFTLVDSSVRGMNAAATGPGEAGEYTGASGFLAYYEICERVKRRGWSVDRDQEGRVGPWARRGTQWVSFDDTRIVASKAKMVKNMGLGGAMVWALDLDDFRDRCGCGRHPLLRTINAALKNTPMPTCDL